MAIPNRYLDRRKARLALPFSTSRRASSEKPSEASGTSCPTFPAWSPTVASTAAENIPARALKAPSIAYSFASWHRYRFGLCRARARGPIVEPIPWARSEEEYMRGTASAFLYPTSHPHYCAHIIARYRLIIGQSGANAFSERAVTLLDGFHHLRPQPCLTVRCKMSISSNALRRWIQRCRAEDHTVHLLSSDHGGR
ncbi:hypothetical protein GY45DRAFT_433019 [Cubamyces sp. BRFM 1775]|nr:hypothetical protein GY45DRAFT_433019 [Cubamyces sp. BRFM 1775]